MKKIILGIVLTFITFLQSCEKERINYSSNENSVVPTIQKIDTKRYTTIACETVDPEGNKGIGQRCRKALGDDCSKETACKKLALSIDFKLPDGWTQQQFEDAWDTEDGISYLQSLGYYQQDLE